MANRDPPTSSLAADDSMADDDPLMGRSLVKDVEPIDAPLRPPAADGEDDDPLSIRPHAAVPRVASPTTSQGSGRGPRRKETFESLMDIAKVGRLESVVGAFRTKKGVMRARLSALREDLLKDEDETNARKKIRDVKSRQWVLELLARDVQLWWERNDRSKSLRACCLLAGALSEVIDGLEYAKEWVLVTRALSKLTTALKQHLEDLKKGNEYEGTRMNWYHKIAGIRGLVARLYLEAATASLLGIDVEKLYLQTSGIGNPVIRQFFIAYLLSQSTEAELLDVRAVARETLMSTRYSGTSLEMLLPLALILSQCQVDSFSFPKVVTYAKSPVAMQALLKVSDPESVCEHAEAVLETVDAFSVGGPTLVSIVAEKMLLCSERLNEKRIKAIMNQAWLVLEKYDATNDEMILLCSARFLELCCARLSVKDTGVLIKDLERRLREGQTAKKNLAPVVRACSELCFKVETEPQRYCTLVNSEPFARLFESLSSLSDSAFAQSTPQTELAKRLIKLFLRNDTKIDIGPAAEWCKALNDSIHVTSFQDERRQINVLIKAFAEKACSMVSTMPLSARLSVFTDLRGRLFQSESALKVLIHGAAFTARDALSKRQESLIASCLAFCHASIPSIACPVERGMLFAHVALVAASLGKLNQSDGLFKAAVQCVADAATAIDEPRLPERRVIELVRTLASALVVAPGHPTALYLVRGLCNAVGKRAEWSNAQPFFACLRLLEAISRTRLPYRLANGIDSNDTLYGDDAQQYSGEVWALCQVQEGRLKQGKHTNDELSECSMLLKKVIANTEARAAQIASASQQHISRLPRKPA